MARFIQGDRGTVGVAFALLLLLEFGACSSGGGGGQGGPDASAGGGASAKGGSAGTAGALGGGTAGGSGGTGGATAGGGSGGNGAAMGGAAGSGGLAVGGAGGAAGSASGGTGGIAYKRPFPDTSSKIAILADQFPNLTPAQQQFVVTHYVGTQKQTLNQSIPLRALDPNFIVLHYKLAIWQSAVSYIIDGSTWGNDLPTVTTNESWFWHNTSIQRVTSTVDGKFLMNLADPGFVQYWGDVLIQQMQAGDYDGVFFDSASPDLLQWEAQSPPEPRLSGTGARDTVIPELGNKTYIQAWQDWIAPLDAKVSAQGYRLIPNTGSFVTSWDNTNYFLTAGVFCEGFADPGWSTSDWTASTNKILALVAANKIVILQNYLSSTSDMAKRIYYLANYLLVKGGTTYLDYFDGGGPLEWYPEWTLNLGTATTTGAMVSDLLQAGVYRRDYQNGFVLVNPTTSPVSVDLMGTYRHLEPMGGGLVPSGGSEPGTIATTNMTNISVPAKGAEIFLR